MTCVDGPKGACCTAGGCTVTAPTTCASLLGTYAGDGTVCADVQCNTSDPQGACCTAFGCQVLTELACGLATGSYVGDATTCNPDPCVTDPGGGGSP